MGIASGDILRITAVMAYGSEPTVMNTFHLRCTDPPGETDAAAMDFVAGWLDTAYAGIIDRMSTSLSFVEIRGFNETQHLPLPTVGWPTLTAATATGDIYAPGVAALVLFRTAALRVLGRKFIGGLTEEDFTSALVAGACLTDLATWAAAIAGGPGISLTTGSYSFGIYSAAHGFHLVTAFVTVAVPAYQRRRRQGRGI